MDRHSVVSYPIKDLMNRLRRVIEIGAMNLDEGSLVPISAIPNVSGLLC